MCSVLHLEAMLIFKIHAATNDHVDVCGFMLRLEAVCMSEVYILKGAHVDTHSPGYHQRSCGCLWAGMPLEAMLISVAYAVVEGHYGTHGLCVDIQGLYYL